MDMVDSFSASLALSKYFDWGYCSLSYNMPWAFTLFNYQISNFILPYCQTSAIGKLKKKKKTLNPMDSID
jgi:hypothetical protein